MPNDTLQELGCILEPTPATLPSVEPLLSGPVELPQNYIVPAWRDCFDTAFQPIKGKIDKRVLDQGALDSCVGHATAVQKSAQEKEQVSPRDIFRQAKRLDGYGLAAFGTTLSAGQDALVKHGAAADELVDRRPSMGRDLYLSLADVTAKVEESRNANKGRSPYTVPRTVFRETLYQTQVPIVTSCQWTAQDNAIGADGIMRMPTSADNVGHAFAIIGWVKPASVTYLVVVNSFGPDWGDHGLFYVSLRDVVNRLGNGYVTLDVPANVAAILAKYEGRNVQVKGTPDLYRIEGGRSRKYPNEIVWFAAGNVFGVDTFEINADDFATVPRGQEISIDECPFKTRELVRQVRQFYGLL